MSWVSIIAYVLSFIWKWSWSVGKVIFIEFRSDLIGNWRLFRNLLKSNIGYLCFSEFNWNFTSSWFKVFWIEIWFKSTWELNFNFSSLIWFVLNLISKSNLTERLLHSNWHLNITEIKIFLVNSVKGIARYCKWLLIIT